jgi:hypothetical protein
MADNWVTPVQTYTTGEVVTAAKLNQEVRDRAEALFNGLTGDASADADIKHAHKTGTLASRPAAGKAGRLYFTTDTKQLFFDDGSNWYCVGVGPYDSFLRANSSVITPSESGHVWVEESGDWEISGNSLNLVSAATSIASLDTKSLLNRPYRVRAAFTSHSTGGSTDVGIIVKYVDASNFIYVRALGSASQIQTRKVIAGVDTNIGSAVAVTWGNFVFYSLEVEIKGVALTLVLNDAGTIRKDFVPNADIQHANLAAATKIGARLIDTVSPIWHLSADF